LTLRNIPHAGQAMPNVHLKRQKWGNKDTVFIKGINRNKTAEELRRIFISIFCSSDKENKSMKYLGIIDISIYLPSYRKSLI
jgi:hypothetical protein